jgi:DNA-binding transcriptional regulator YhcF (GntR family)
MRLWLSKNGEVPLREQLATQMLLGIVSGDLKPGQKLPSIREIAHRYQIHSNTVSAAYRSLASRGWVEFRKGSGVYVRERGAGAPPDPTVELDQLIDSLLRSARQRGHTLAQIQGRVKRWLLAQPPDHFLLVEPDAEFREILIAEISDATGFRTIGVGLERSPDADTLAGAAPIAMYGLADEARAWLPPWASLTLLRLRSIEGVIAGQRRPAADELITVVSGWDGFLKWAKTVLIAAALDPDALSFREAAGPDWKKGLASSSMVITDALTARSLPAGCQARVFKVIADASLEELINLKSFFLGSPGV